MPVEVAAALMIIVPLVAYLLSYRTRSRWAFWILRVGGLFFALAAALAVIARNICVGDLVNGYHTCIGGEVVTGLFSFMTPAILLSITAYLAAGPILLVIAAICEAVVRSRKTA